MSVNAPPEMDDKTNAEFERLISETLTNPRATTVVDSEFGVGVSSIFGRSSHENYGEWLKSLISGLNGEKGTPYPFSTSGFQRHVYNFGFNRPEQRLQVYSRYAKIVCAEYYDTPPTPTHPNQVGYEEFHWKTWNQLYKAKHRSLPIVETSLYEQDWFKLKKAGLSEEYKLYYQWRRDLEKGQPLTPGPSIFSNPQTSMASTHHPTVTPNPFTAPISQASAAEGKRKAPESSASDNLHPAAKRECSDLAVGMPPSEELVSGERLASKVKGSYEESRLQWGDSKRKRVYLAEIELTAEEFQASRNDSFTVRYLAKDGSVIKGKLKICDD
ncbi:hypothetical protein B0T21DRAFT_416438 [Apiosordaria backusii]|uniref:Uncharacterized protein n=1 Tax=Apiosordaria backusii TaxID=314023 RepID=A0AA39ZY40_9PEZI|nr:hypothetical protein B0T21DRAFT_416438 [Apiosordaria backusii]